MGAPPGEAGGRALGQHGLQLGAHGPEQAAAHAPGLEGGRQQGLSVAPRQPRADGQGICQGALLALEGRALEVHLLRGEAQQAVLASGQVVHW